MLDLAGELGAGLVAALFVKLFGRIADICLLAGVVGERLFALVGRVYGKLRQLAAILFAARAGAKHRQQKCFA